LIQANKGNQTMQTTTNQTIVLTPDLFALIDHAGALDSEIKALTKQLDAIKTQIKANGAGDHAGFIFTAKVIDSERITIDYKTICEKLNPSRQLVTAYTSSAIIQSIRFTKV
jgi:hypothetical protein